ncbi:MAG: helix-turn-helix transcriptional regulator [bacterium]|nr:helix-turn-helix transcriptional regulator [bacterium]
MNKKNKISKATDFGEYLKGQLKDGELRKHYRSYGKQLEIAYQILQLRIKNNISQEEFAKRIGTTQSNIARMESGSQNFTIEMLDKVAETFNKKLQILIK